MADSPAPYKGITYGLRAMGIPVNERAGPRGTEAWVSPRTGRSVNVSPGAGLSPDVVVHELTHLRQNKSLGPFANLVGNLDYLLAILRRKDPGSESFMERQAYEEQAKSIRRQQAERQARTKQRESDEASEAAKTVGQAFGKTK